MKHHLHRSITFWGGLLVMAFIVWAWQDSLQRSSTLWYRFSSLASKWGGIQFAQGTLANPQRLHVLHEPLTRFPLEQERLPQPGFHRAAELSPELRQALTDVAMGTRKGFRLEEHFKMNMTLAPPGAWALFIPHWLLLLTVVVPWTALLLWRARRRKRAALTPM